MRKMNIVYLLFTILLVVPGCTRLADTVMPPPETPLDTQPLTVMTYNVYVGSSTANVLGVENVLQVPAEVSTVYNNVIASDFPARAVAIAASIKAHEPHLIGLQEISLIRSQSPGDRIIGGTEPAEEVVLDYLKILMNALAVEGLDYRVAAQVENVDVEMPMFTDTGVVDVRLTDYDVLLARGDVDVSRPTQANFKTALTIELLQLDVKRGYVAGGCDCEWQGLSHREYAFRGIWSGYPGGANTRTD